MIDSPYFFDHGGPAFPIPSPDLQTHGVKTVDELRRLAEGMTLRDYFAAKAMAAFICVQTNAIDVQRAMAKAKVSDPMQLFARNAYDMADAMLKARQP